MAPRRIASQGDAHQHAHRKPRSSSRYVTRDRFVALGLFQLGTRLALGLGTTTTTAAAQPAPPDEMLQERRWKRCYARRRWTFDDPRARARAKRLLLVERVIADILSGYADAWLQPPRQLDALLEVLRTREESADQPASDIASDRLRDTANGDVVDERRLPAAFRPRPLSVQDAADLSRDGDDATIALRLLGVSAHWSDTLADAEWGVVRRSRFPEIAPGRLGTLGEWTFRAARNKLKGRDVADTFDWTTFLQGCPRRPVAQTGPGVSATRRGERAQRGRRVACGRTRSGLQPAPQREADGDLVTVAEAASILGLVPAAIRQRVRRHALVQIPYGHTHLVSLAAVRAAG